MDHPQGDVCQRAPFLADDLLITITSKDRIQAARMLLGYVVEDRLEAADGIDAAIGLLSQAKHEL